jgi:hypothetical protein
MVIELATGCQLSTFRESPHATVATDRPDSGGSRAQDGYAIAKWAQVYNRKPFEDVHIMPRFAAQLMQFKRLFPLVPFCQRSLSNGASDLYSPYDQHLPRDDTVQMLRHLSQSC